MINMIYCRKQESRSDRKYVWRTSS